MYWVCLCVSEMVVVLVNYIWLLGFDVKVYIVISLDVDLNWLIVVVGLVEVVEGWLMVFFVGLCFGVVVVMMMMEIVGDVLLVCGVVV